MRILCLTARLPYPPNRGDRLRAYNFIRQLSLRHQITLASFIEDDAETANLAALRPYCSAIHVVHLDKRHSMTTAAAGITRTIPLQSLYYQSTAMSNTVDRLLGREHFDVVYVHLFRMAQYVEKHPGPYRVLDLTDVISQEIARSLPYRDARWRAIYRLELPRIARYERELPARFEETWLISESDRQALVEAGAVGNLHVVRNGVDIDTYRPLGRPAGTPALIFVGHMGVAHNVDAAETLAREVLPLVRQDVPSAHLNIVGAEPNEAVRALASLPGVRVAGHVQDLNAALNQAAVFVAPLRFAAGVQNKVLEAMAAGLPVVTNALVNAGLGARDGIELILAEEPAEQAAAIVALLHDPIRRATVGSAGRAFVQQQFRWDHVARRMADIERSLADSGRGR
jgi:sugar transferase (PEP-CTERM/EpsH1 system associated)